ncbi:MAG TPA: response regulator [Candidatus Eisenbacteria bacterium]|nr:response regulator [Candidatus Eisenbacteria bacterium]
MARILVLDDFQQMTSLLQRILGEAGHQVTVANTVSEALAALGKSCTDLVVTDIFIPDQDGLAFIKELRALYPTIKILAISGGVGRFPADPYLLMAKYSGAQLTLPKPFEPAALLKSVSELLCS